MDYRGTVWGMSDNDSTGQAALDAGVYYDGVEQAEEALQAWAQRKAEVMDVRDAIVAGALTAGVKPARAARLARLGASTVERIPRRAPGQQFPPALEYGQILSQRRRRYQDADDSRPDRPGESTGRAAVARWAARILLHPTSTGPAGDTEDAQLLDLAAEARRIADDNRGHDDDYTRGMVAEAAQIAAEAARLRAEGYPALDGLDAGDRAAAHIAFEQESLRAKADALGVTPEKLQAMTPEQEADAWQALPDDD